MHSTDVNKHSTNCKQRHTFCKKIPTAKQIHSSCVLLCNKYILQAILDLTVNLGT